MDVVKMIGVFILSVGIPLTILIIIDQLDTHYERVKIKKRETMYYNELRRCKSCFRCHRKYQSILRSLKNSSIFAENECPHCGSGNISDEIKAYSISIYDKHRDCPKLNGRQRYKIWKRIREVEKIYKIIGELDELQAYERRRKVGGEL